MRGRWKYLETKFARSAAHTSTHCAGLAPIKEALHPLQHHVQCLEISGLPQHPVVVGHLGSRVCCVSRDLQLLKCSDSSACTHQGTEPFVRCVRVNKEAASRGGRDFELSAALTCIRDV